MFYLKKKGQSDDSFNGDPKISRDKLLYTLLLNLNTHYRSNLFFIYLFFQQFSKDALNRSKNDIKDIYSVTKYFYFK